MYSISWLNTFSQKAAMKLDKHLDEVGTQPTSQQLSD